MSNLSYDLLAKFIAMREMQGEKIDIGDAAMVISELVTLMERHKIGNEKDLYSEIKNIKNKIEQVKIELCEKLPNGVVPDATKELDEVVKSTEDATNRILDSAEKIRGIIATIGGGVEVDQVNEEVISIFEACNFQDITGQRIKKVTATLKYIEEAVENILSSIEGKSAPTAQSAVGIAKPKTLAEMTKSDLMNGPQFTDRAPTQDDVDRLFNNA